MVEPIPHVPPGRIDGARNAENVTVTDLVHRLIAQLSKLFHQEVKLAAREISESLTKLAMNLASVAAGAVVIYAGLLLLLMAAVFGLATVLPIWLASLAVGLTATIIGFALLLAAKQKVTVAELTPTHLGASLRKDKDVLTRKVS